MKRFWIHLSLILCALSAFLGAPALADDENSADGRPALGALLTGFQEVPPIFSEGRAIFRARLNEDRTALMFQLEYRNLSSPAMAAHIHFGQRGVNGGVVAFLCGGGGQPDCPESGPVTGTITADNVIGPVGQGIAPGEFEKLLRAIRVGATYANIHTAQFPDGEIRGQVRVFRRPGEGEPPSE